MRVPRDNIALAFRENHNMIQDEQYSQNGFSRVHSRPGRRKENNALDGGVFTVVYCHHWFQLKIFSLWKYGCSIFQSPIFVRHYPDWARGPAPMKKVPSSRSNRRR
ncbi:hypothetical protein BDV28DRAFT_1543 [Aspergillus coremiiformis]|uniref:Uncharacterized protein n=1 Tax=Aspergillus coremiiformis TaxID=138285 RepID=A0A5N6ZH76_9EURO|nr:hypothetical protein BDV28DRAFT_1543 [Aspergillus coremiiformis]